jgi:hypothetical protein
MHIYVSKPRSISLLLDIFPLLLDSALRADKSLEWQLAALDALSIWLLRATRSPSSSQLASAITPSQWEPLVSLTWTRWSSAPNSNSIQKILKEVFSKTLLFQQKVFSDWRERDVTLLEKAVLRTGADIKFQCFLIELLVRRITGGGGILLNMDNNWVTNMLLRMKDSSVGPAVGKCVVSVLMVRRTELIDSDPTVRCRNDIYLLRTAMVGGWIHGKAHS